MISVDRRLSSYKKSFTSVADNSRGYLLLVRFWNCLTHPLYAFNSFWGIVSGFDLSI
jgi:hypothetical protein